MLCPSLISRFGTLAAKQRFDAASAMGHSRTDAVEATRAFISAVARKRTSSRSSRYVRFVPKPALSNRSKRGNSITSSAAASSLSGTVRPERLRGLQVDPDQLLCDRGTQSNTEWGTVRFLKVEECQECHGG